MYSKAKVAPGGYREVRLNPRGAFVLHRAEILSSSARTESSRERDAVGMYRSLGWTQHVCPLLPWCCEGNNNNTNDSCVTAMASPKRYPERRAASGPERYTRAGFGVCSVRAVDYCERQIRKAQIHCSGTWGTSVVILGIEKS